MDIRRGPQTKTPPSDDDVIAEVPVALVYNGISHAVMMATPDALEDFALGFSLSEGILQHRDELYGIELHREPDGLALHLEISAQRQAELRQRRRNLAGRTGCGLCGTESLAQAIRPVSRVTAPDIRDDAIQHALDGLRHHQPLQRTTGASHAAAWCSTDGHIHVAREDVGRHNALDKLIGTLMRHDQSLAHGFVLVSSRASYEMVQKSCSVGIGALVAVSAATSLAVDQAREAGLLLVGFARPGRHVVYHAPLRERDEPCQNTPPHHANLTAAPFALLRC